MKLVKIKRSSIKKNPDAFRTYYDIPSQWEITGRYIGDKLPKWIDSVSVITSHSMPMIGEQEYEFQVVKPVTKKFFDRIEKASGKERLFIEMKRDIQRMESMFPEPAYKYEYTNPLIECNGCHNNVRLKNIQTDYIFDSDGEEYNTDKCPKCGELNSFDYQYEKINDVV